MKKFAPALFAVTASAALVLSVAPVASAQSGDSGSVGSAIVTESSEAGGLSSTIDIIEACIAAYEAITGGTTGGGAENGGGSLGS